MTGALFPQIDSRVFPADEKAQALEWVARVQ
ncbi:hypothetical protein [Mesorhizobium sp.]